MPAPKNYKEVKIRYSPIEWEHICKRADEVKMRKGTYIRFISVRGEMKICNVEAIGKLTLAINRYGNNLNQIARVVNSTNSVYKNDIDKIVSDMKELKNIVEEYIETFENEVI